MRNSNSLKRGPAPNITSIMFAEMGAIAMFPVKEGQKYTESEEYKVAKRSKAGDLMARKEMIERNYRLAMSQSKKFNAVGLGHEDIVQEGIIGLIRAAELFDPDQGNKFSTYAYWWVRQAMSRAVMEKSRAVRVPVHITESSNKIRKFSEEFYKEFSRYPSPPEVSVGLEIPVAKVKDILESVLPMTSLNKPITEDGQELMDVIASQNSAEDEIALNTMREILQKYLSILTPVEATILSYSTGFPLKGDGSVPVLKSGELAKILPKKKDGRTWTTEDVRVLRGRAMRKLRARVEHSPLMGLKDCLT